MRPCALLLALFLSACSSSSSATPATLDDAGYDAGDGSVVVDSTAPQDDGLDDAAAEASAEASPADALDPKTAILGTLDGSCGVVAAHLAETTPSAEWNALAFMTGESYAKTSLSLDGQRVFDTANAGGSSGESEVMSFEVLHFCEGASLVKTETEISYAPPDDAGASSITDILVSIGGRKVGVSVTRAYKPAPLVMSDAEVQALLEKKLEGINRSSVRVSAADRWVKQILHVFVADAAAKAAVERVLPSISAALRADTLILVTRTTGGGFIYCNPDPALGAECPPI